MRDRRHHGARMRLSCTIFSSRSRPCDRDHHIPSGDRAMTKTVLTAACVAALLGAACNRPSSAQADAAATPQDAPDAGKPFTTTVVANLQQPWAMTFLPDGRLLVTEKKGALKVVDVVQRQDRRRQRRAGGRLRRPGRLRRRRAASEVRRQRPRLPQLRRSRRRRHPRRRGGARQADARRRGRRCAVRSEGDLAAGAEGRWARPLRPSHRLRPGRHAVDQLRASGRSSIRRRT